MTWNAYYRGNGVPRVVQLPEPPPWRTFPRQPTGAVFQPPAGLIEAVNAALCLRRPLLITGLPGSGKSTVIEQVAQELCLGPVLNWHITSRSTLADGLYRYDALGRIHAQRLGDRDPAGAAVADDIAPFLHLGPLGSALAPGDTPRALLIDEIDKSDLDLPSDLLDVLERGEFEIPELARYERDEVDVRLHRSDATHRIVNGRVACTHFPFIVMTSNGEQIFPAPFLRRCVRYTMTPPTLEMLRAAVGAHLGMDVPEGSPVAELIQGFADRLDNKENLAVDQLLNAVFLLSMDDAPQGQSRHDLIALLLRELSRA